MKRMTSLSTVILFVASFEHAESDSIHLPASCIGADDGYQWMKMLDGDEYPAVHQLCNNEYMVIDVNEDPNVIDYFSSFTPWHYALSGPTIMDQGNWEQWWLPSAHFIESVQNDAENEEYYSFTISPECSSCGRANNFERNIYSPWNDDEYGDRTGYYMNGLVFGCMAKNKPAKDCRWDYESYSCNLCTKDSSDADLGYHVVSPSQDADWAQWLDYYQNLTNGTWENLGIGLCGVLPQSSYTDQVPNTRDECWQDSGRDNVKPSIGNNGRFCVCVKPTQSFDGNRMNMISVDEFESVQTEYGHNKIQKKEDHEVDISSIDDVYELYQSDFVSGTYRIQKSGTYKIMENIIFDFNAGDLNDPNVGISWWPTSNQSDQYPGAGSTRENYFLGFFAGITVEVDNVVIDLNDHEIKQSMAFYFQQRFFSCIALKSVAFPLSQGPGMFGSDPKFANNVMIKNGVIGLSSHHGIHGHYNRDVIIENVHVRDFETHGIQMSYFHDLTMKNVEIGPSSTVAYLKGEYAYARWTVQALERIMESDDYNDIFPVTFSGRDEELEFEHVIENLRDLMDIAFKTAMGIEEYDDNDVEYQTAKAMFINEDGIPTGAVMYGLFLNLWVSNVFHVHPSIKHAENAVVENLKIHGLHHKTIEYIRMDKPSTAFYRNQFNGPLDAMAVLDDQILVGNDNITWSEVEYKGSPLTDALILLAIATDDWSEQNAMLLPEDYSSWALGDNQWNDSDSEGHPYLGCNNDRMGHSPKGVIGIRMDGVDGASFQNVEISDLHESGKMGSDLCGEYWGDSMGTFYTKHNHGGGNLLQNTPYFYGYTGNRVHGIYSDFSVFQLDGDITLSELMCDTGLVRGIGLYPQSTLTFTDNSSLSISRLSAGDKLYDTDTDALNPPYNAAVAKPVHVIWTDLKHNNTFNSTIYGAPKTRYFSCIYGRDGVNTSDWMETVDNSQCHSMQSALTKKAVDSFRTHYDPDHGFNAMNQSTIRFKATAIALTVALLALFALQWSWRRVRDDRLTNKKDEISPLLSI